MKFVVFAIFFLTQYANGKQDLKTQADLCIKINNLDGSEIYKIHNSENVDPNHEGYQKFMECFWKLIGFLDRNGDLQTSVIWSTYYDSYRNRYDEIKSREMADRLIKKCEGVQGATAALKAINMSVCLTS